MLIEYRIRFEKDGVTIAQNIGGLGSTKATKDSGGGGQLEDIGSGGQLEDIGGGGQLEDIGGGGQLEDIGSGGPGRCVAVILGPVVIGCLGRQATREIIPAKPKVVALPKEKAVELRNLEAAKKQKTTEAATTETKPDQNAKKKRNRRK